MTICLKPFFMLFILWHRMPDDRPKSIAVIMLNEMCKLVDDDIIYDGLRGKQ